MFVNRTKELSQLEGRYHSNKAEFVVVYGRRRVGKTVLLKQFVQGKEHVYFLADLRPEADQLGYFTQLQTFEVCRNLEGLQRKSPKAAVVYTLSRPTVPPSSPLHAG